MQTRETRGGSAEWTRFYEFIFAGIKILKKTVVRFILLLFSRGHNDRSDNCLGETERLQNIGISIGPKKNEVELALNIPACKRGI